MNHCRDCKAHSFKGLYNYCRTHKRIIKREKWDLKKDNGEWVCSCERFIDRYQQKVQQR